MNDLERAKHTHTKDDPQQWPDPPVNTVQKVSGRILGVILMLIVASVGRYIIEECAWYFDGVGIAMIMCAGLGLIMATRWETTRRL